MARALVNLPKTARRGEIVTVKALIAHPMETGYRPGPNGTILPRDIITRFTCEYAGVLVLDLDLHPAMSASPYFSFTLRAAASGPVLLTWSGDGGFHQVETVQLDVS
jgi:sulfur-oxidizing protein SoxZ